MSPRFLYRTIALGYRPPALETILRDPNIPAYVMLLPAQSGPNQ